MRRADPPAGAFAKDPDVLLRALVEAPVDPLPAAQANALRDRITARLEARGVGRQRDARHTWLVFAAAALLPVLVWAASRTTGVRERRAGVALVTAAAGSITLDAEGLSTGPDGSARASLPCGAVVEVGPSAHVRFTTAADKEVRGERVELSAGRVQVQVPKLAAGTDLRVHTADATVIVHGTRFSVEERVAPDSGKGETWVSVSEGLVEVDTAQGVRMLTGGMTVVVSAQPAGSAQVPPLLTEDRAASHRAVTPAPPVTTTSTLGAENALLAEAMRLRRDHQPDRALARLDEFLARYPSSPLAATARAERLGLLEEIGSAAKTTGP